MIPANRIQYLSILVISYMLISMGWWTILLNKKNNETYQSRLELIQKDRLLQSSHEKSLAEESKEIVEEHKRQKYMIFGEAIVFGLMLVAGIWLIYRTFKKEYALSQQQNNFLLSITHELKTPLASIGLTLDTFKNRELTQNQKNTLADNAQEETKRLENIVENLLVSSRLHSKTTLNKEAISISQLINDIESKIISQYPNQTIVNEIDDQLEINADRESYRIVIKNIIENALKYSPTHGVVKLRFFKSSDEITISCEDQGSGISDQEKKRVTEKFYRVGNEETRKTKGTGLGLYLVDQIVSAHGHTLKITDNVPKGTIISIIVPK